MLVHHRRPFVCTTQKPFLATNASNAENWAGLTRLRRIKPVQIVMGVSGAKFRIDQSPGKVRRTLITPSSNNALSSL